MLILDAIIESFQVVQFVVGVIMLGLVPVDVIIDTLMMPHSNNEEQLNRLREIMEMKQNPPPPTYGSDQKPCG